MNHDMTTSTAVLCKSCGAGISTTVRGNSVRCPACRASNYVPKVSTDAPIPQALPVELVPLAWDPVSTPAAPESAAEPCPVCGEALVWEPAGTLLFCRDCDAVVFPAELEPAREDAADPRRVSSQAERDGQALEVAERRAVVVAAVRQVLGEQNLTPATRGRLEWFAEQLARAETMSRLQDLAQLLAAERIRRTGWFARDAPNPVGRLRAEVDADEEDDDYAEYDVDQDDTDQDDPGPLSAGQGLLALPAGQSGRDPLAEVHARGWTINRSAPYEECQISYPRHGTDAGPQPCGGGSRHTLGPMRVCGHCYRALTNPLT